MAKSRTLIIVESPEKAKTIRTFLPNDEYTILASRGHVADLANDGKYNMGIDIDHDFKLKYKTSADKLETINNLINAAANVDLIVLATDKDREGECISSLLKERLIYCNKKIVRAVFETITEAGVKYGLAHKREIDEDLVNAAKARRALDRIVGFMGSPYVMNRLGRGNSAGRVQSVALRLIVDKEEEITKFVPDEYWTIKAKLHNVNNDQFIAAYNTRAKLDEKTAKELKLELEKATYVVKKVVAEQKEKHAPPPLITSTLQIIASTKYNLNPTETMEGAQRIYDSGKITYMRTDSLRIDGAAITSCRDWIRTNRPGILPSKANVYKNADAAQDAHEAIRPTDVNITPNQNPITVDDKVYKLIWDMFVASQCSPAIYNTVSVTIVTDNKRELKVNGSVLVDAGWLNIIDNISEDEADDTNALPNLTEKESLFLEANGIILQKKFTQPPPRFKIGSLIRALEKNGVGRPSTYATIMQKIIETREFVIQNGKSLVPTEKGKNVIELLKNKFSFMNIDYTSDFEKKLDLIADGKKEYKEILSNFYGEFKNELEIAKQNTPTSSNQKCSKCGSGMIIRKTEKGTFLGCESYPECKNIMKCNDAGEVIVSEKINNDIVDNVLCPLCKSPMFIKHFGNNKFYGCSTYPKCKGTRKVLIENEKCNICGAGLFYATFGNDTYKSCENYPKCVFTIKQNQ